MDRPTYPRRQGQFLSAILGWAGKLSPIQGFSLGLTLSLLLAGVDLITGYELAFSLFYLIPMVLVAWSGTRPLVWTMAAADALILQMANLMAGEQHDLVWVFYWNTFSRGAFFLITGLLVLQLKQHLEKETATARRDPLTNLVNRRGLEEAYQAVAHRLAREPGAVAVVTIDLDRFKQLNDSRGHGEGDRLLRTFAQTAQTVVRPTDTLARVGGDEFLLLVEGVDRSGVVDLVQRLQTAVEEAFSQEGWPTGISQGIAFQAGPPVSLSELVERADRQLYRAKEAGRGRFVLEDPA